ncbi:MAG: hypothetical protein NTU66_07475 [Elusimicrobia bacterium]|nr:hypothetical protein [Elusimicrobiota bacterium]
MLNEDYKEMLRILLDNKVKFLIVGAYALGVYGYPRATGDVDIWVEPTLDNSRKLYKSLKQFGAPLSNITRSIFSEEGLIFQIGVAPRRIDIITSIDGVTFKHAFHTKEEIEIEHLKIPFLSKTNLIKNKKATGRDKDKLDIKYLNKHK